MPVNADKPSQWKADIAQSVDFYNDWFLRFAPKAFRDTRTQTTGQVEAAMAHTDNLANISPAILKEHPSVLPMLRMATAPPIARDRLIGLSGVSPNLVQSMEERKRIPPRMAEAQLAVELEKIGRIIMRMADPDIFPWLEHQRAPSAEEVHRAATIVADRLCGTVADPIIRNAQEQRQLADIKQWLEKRGYSYIKAGSRLTIETIVPGTFAFHLNVPGHKEDESSINMPMDAVIMPHNGPSDSNWESVTTRVHGKCQQKEARSIC